MTGFLIQCSSETIIQSIKLLMTEYCNGFFNSPGVVVSFCVLL